MADSTFDKENLYINNNIGIGTNEPTARLHIVSPTEISNKVFLENIGGSLLKISTETSSASIGTENAFPLSIQTDGVPRIAISGTGNITITESLSVQNSLTVTGNTNIGTDTTPANLQVKGNVTANAFSGNGTNLSGLVKQAGDTMSGPLTVQNSLTVTGNTNIGTDTTPANLQVKGNVAANAFSGNGTSLSGLVKQAGDTMTGPLAIQSNLSVSGNVGIGTTQPGAKLELVANSTTWGGWYEAIRLGQSAHSAITHPGGNLLFGLHSDRQFYFADMAEGQYIMTIDANPAGGGNVGIGTTQPGAKLEVVANSHTWSGWYEAIRLGQNAHSAITHPGGNLLFGLHSDRRFYFADMAEGQYIMTIDANPAGGGNVGIGTTAPSSKLDVRGNLFVQAEVRADGGFQVDGQTVIDADAGWHRSYGNTGWYNGTHGGGWHMADSTWIRSYGGKNIYHDQGILRTDGTLQVGPDGNRFVVNTSGNVGIGTMSPGAKLDVAGDIKFNNTIATPGRMHITGGERLYLLNKDGVIIGKEWGGNGNLSVQGSKNFMIDHPLQPEHKYLIHSCLEGPEIAVFYRGEAQLEQGEATVTLPEYFEALTRKEKRTVMLTPKLEGETPVSMLAASVVKEGKFVVRKIDGKNPSQKFYWEVKAVRADIEELVVEEMKISPPEIGQTYQ